MVNENIILSIKNRYEHECKFKQALDKSEKMILNYFQELQIYIHDIEKELSEKISLSFNKDDKLVEFKIEDEYIMFKRYEKCIKVLMSNYNNDIEECENDEFTSIVPYEDFHGCKYKGLQFGYGDIDFMLSRAFKSLKFQI